MNLESITLQTIEIAQKAAAFIKSERENFDPAKIEFKGHSSNLVSYVDKEAEKILVEGLSKILPEAGFITEEGTIEQSNKEYCWLIDPLDGTTNFLHNVPIYSTSIGLLHNDFPVAGVIIDIPMNEIFHAWKGGGAYANSKKIQVSMPKTLGECLIATGFPYQNFDKSEEYMNVLKGLMENSHGLRRCGSAAIDMAWVAAGRFEGYFEYNINAWDIAAGCIILEEAGGKVTDFKGGNDYVFGKNIIASCGSIHSQFQEIVEKNW